MTGVLVLVLVLVVLVLTTCHPKPAVRDAYA